MSDAGSPLFERRAEMLSRIVALNLTGLLYASAALMHLPVAGSQRNLFLFAIITIVLPVVSAAILCFDARAAASDGPAKTILSTCKSTVTAAALLIATLTVIAWVAHFTVEYWTNLMRLLTGILVFVHFLTTVILCVAPGSSAAQVIGRANVLFFPVTPFRATLAMTAAVPAAMLLAFRFEPEHPYLNAFFGFAQGLRPAADWLTLTVASLAAGAALIICGALLKLEHRMALDPQSRLSKLRRWSLLATIAGIFYFYFDYRLYSDVLHFLTNAGPANQMLRSGAVPLVTAFSQYGPGPLVSTWLAFVLDAPSFNAANVLSQILSLFLYAALVTCLYRMSEYRLSALLLGFLAIGVLLAGWWGGNGSLYTVPSSMGMRYLPNALVVLAISMLGDGRRLSVFVFLSMLLSALWSFETLAGSVAIFGLFVLTASIAARDVAGFFRACLLGIVCPIAAAVAVTCLGTFMFAGMLPDYPAYLYFARIYNMTSDLWSIAGSGTFLGWTTVATAVMTAMSLAWHAAFLPNNTPPLWNSQLLLYRVLPMAALATFMSSYYAGRSVDFTLIISFLPVSALLIPPILSIWHDAIHGKKPQRYLSAIPVLALIFILTFSFTALYRKNAPYSLALGECIHQRHCTPASLGKVFAERYPLRSMLDRAADPGFFDTTGLATEAIDIVQRFAPEAKQIALFLGIHPVTKVWSVHTDAVLLHLGKAHRWPVSYVLSDELNPALQRKILNANVRLTDGEVVVVRKDESQLGKLESALVGKIRSQAILCPLWTSGKMVAAYKVSLSGCN